MRKSFDNLTIADDFMFCTVMEDPILCKELLTMLLKDKVGRITKLFKQKPIETQIASKGVRLDIMIEDEDGKLYDVEMQTTDQKNLPERMRYYQCAIDNSAINKGGDYNDLPDTFIIFLCTFDYLQEGLPVYTINPSCKETGQTFNDGTTKIIVNSTASEKAEENLKAFLSYMNGQPPETAFTKQLEKRVNETKENEEKRREYMLLKSFEMDAR
ncbi:Rpn family recombination-promoting nuclease/putative transposase, partial [Treponema sp. OMZ 840]|uniref:Rpn family recombination-promoting nuclease/putative transposase n=1 Tax=Treponema sp. OMZ 840 TaxID=244313 RepID=UPI003D8C40C6